MKALSVFENEVFKVIESDYGTHLFVVNGSRIFDLDLDPHHDLEGAGGKALVESLQEQLDEPDYIGTEAMKPPPLSALSLNVAQSCNLSCAYCYADEGKFQKSARLMSEATAFRAIDRLLEEAAPAATVTVGFMGGEPLLNRSLLHSCVHYAECRAADCQRGVRFSLTTNATLLTEEDVRLFADHPFTVSVSLDGPQGDHDRLRRHKNGRGSYEAVLEKLQLFAEVARPIQLSARATVTPRHGGLLEALDHLIAIGFDDVGFSPVLTSPDPRYSFTETDFEGFLGEMIACGEKATDFWAQGKRYPFGNLETALMEIHCGSHRPYPCGAGAGYLSVNAEGALYACHRLIDDPQYHMGDIHEGLASSSREELLSKQLVDRQEPCRSCWARYLCGGGCYHEVKARGRIACDYIRGWLTFCLSAYAKLQVENSSYFDSQQVVDHGQ